MGQAKKRGTLDQRIKQAHQQSTVKDDPAILLRYFEVMAPGFGQLVPDRGRDRDLHSKIAKHMPRFNRVEQDNGDIVHYAGFTTPEFGEDHTRAHWFVTVTDKAHYSGPKFSQITGLARQNNIINQTPGMDEVNALAEIQWMPVYTTKHALQRWRQRTHLDTEQIPGSAEYFTCRVFQDEFRLRGAPKQRAWGCPVDDGIFLGEWMTRQEMHTLNIGFEKEMGTESFVAWQHDCHSHIHTPAGVVANPVAYNVIASTYRKPADEWFFLAKTFISYRDASFGQASLAMSYDKDPETTAQQFRRNGAEEWLDHTRESVLTKKAREMNILQ